MQFNFVVGKYLDNKNEVKIYGGFLSESSAKSFVEWKEIDSFGGIFFVWDSVNNTAIFYSSTYKNERWLSFEKATIYNATSDTDELLSDKIYNCSELLSLIKKVC